MPQGDFNLKISRTIGVRTDFIETLYRFICGYRWAYLIHFSSWLPKEMICVGLALFCNLHLGIFPSQCTFSNMLNILAILAYSFGMIPKAKIFTANQVSIRTATLE